MIARPQDMELRRLASLGLHESPTVIARCAHGAEKVGRRPDPDSGQVFACVFFMCTYTMLAKIHVLMMREQNIFIPFLF